MHQQKTITKTLSVLFSCLFLLTACGGGGSDAQPVLRPPVEAPAQNYKLAELDFIDAELRASHPDMFYFKSESQYEMDLADFRDASIDMSDDTFRVELAKFVAGIGDQHTYVLLPIPQMKKFPFRIWWDLDRAIVTEADEPYQYLLGQELVSIDGTPLSFIRDPAMQYLAHENDYWKDALSPEFLQLADVLENEGIIATADLASFEFEDIEGTTTYLDVNSQVDFDNWMEIQDTYDARPLYKLSEDNYTYTVDNDILYIQYNSAFGVFGYPLSAFIDDLLLEMENPDIAKVVVDIRFNYGGQIDHFVPVIDALSQTRLNSPNTLFVLTGRNSFSSAIGAIYSFQEMTDATFVGGPTGGKPNGFSHVVGFILPGSGNQFYLSTDYHEVTTDDVDSFYPEYEVLFTQQDFIDGTDPAIEFVRAFQ